MAGRGVVLADGEATVAVVYLDLQPAPERETTTSRSVRAWSTALATSSLTSRAASSSIGHASPFRQRRGDEPPGRACPRRLGSEMGGCVLAATR